MFEEEAMREPGKLFIFEGPDGVGKTELAARAAAYLKAGGADCVLMSFPGRENGTLGRLVYELHHDAARFGVPSIHPASLQVLHVAAHIDAIESRILPALAGGRHVVLDRFWWSTWVYGTVTGVSRRILRAMIRAERACWGSTQPDGAFLVTRAWSLREEEVRGRWGELRAGYGELAEAEGRRYPVHAICNDRTVEESAGRVGEILDALLGAKTI